jgi:hypothetical protein
VAIKPRFCNTCEDYQRWSRPISERKAAGPARLAGADRDAARR